ncbi:MAG: hydroxylamine oxidase [Desulfobacterales bacterium]|nr:hydroxylamine oxidase [Desulfobacterales bacterium]
MPISDATQECISCHESINPGIVADWRMSRHSSILPKNAVLSPEISRKVSSQSIPKDFQNNVVGCAECHTMRSESHKDSFDHNGYTIHVVVSPNDCATCHSTESEQFKKNIMANAYGNLADNPVYQDLKNSINGTCVLKYGRPDYKPSDKLTDEESCLYCHGTKLEVTGTETRDTDAGDLEFPIISGWPNHGVGRINLDGSMGSCGACHSRHSFSIEMARKPETCKECHNGPDVPAYKVYTTSKHGNIYSAFGKNWDFKSVPWVIGKHFNAPTCATCHVSLLTNSIGEIVSKRTHQMSDRLSNRLFGLFYSHPYPKEPNTSIIKNKDKLPLPTTFTGEFASEFLIDKSEQIKRNEIMQASCLNCHASSWVKAHFIRLENTIKQTNASTLAGTSIMLDIWHKGFAFGPFDKGSMFDDAIEKQWSKIWLFYANNTRFASAMAGGGDYGVFADGRFELSNQIAILYDWLNIQTRLVRYTNTGF